MSESIRLLPLEATDGPTNMAADEVLLESAADGVASLRFYGWTEATVSLGYFQPAAARLADPLLARLPFVRRLTGGQALVHHLEVTYAVALPAGPPWQTEESWLCRMHQIIATAFRRLDVSLDCPTTEQRDPSTALCFRQWSAGDLLCAGSKVVGSAQRKRRGCLLQHGGILLARSPHAPTLPGIAEQSGQEVTGQQARQLVAEEFAGATAWTVREEGWSAAETSRIDELATTRYRSPSWNAKR